MSIYAIADLHLATADLSKSMEVFGRRWQNYIEKLNNNWSRVITDDDTVIIAGDISWGLKPEEAVDNILNMFSRTSNNKEFVEMVKKNKFL